MFLPRALNLCACGAEGLADVISIHDHLTNQILLSRSGKQRARYALHIRCIYALCVSAGHVQGVWLERVDQEPTLLSSARKHGLTRLGYMSLKPEQLSAIDAILRGRDTFVSTDWIRQVTGIPGAAVFCRLAYRASYRDINIEQTRSDGCVASPVAYARPGCYAWMALSRITRFSRPRFMNTNDICSLSSAPHAHKLSARERNTHGERGSSSID